MFPIVFGAFFHFLTIIAYVSLLALVLVWIGYYKASPGLVKAGRIILVVCTLLGFLNTWINDLVFEEGTKDFTEEFP